MTQLCYALYTMSNQSNECIKQALLKWGPEKSSAVINQNQSVEVKRPCYKEHLIHTTFYNQLN